MADRFAHLLVCVLEDDHGAAVLVGNEDDKEDVGIALFNADALYVAAVAAVLFLFLAQSLSPLCEYSVMMR